MSGKKVILGVFLLLISVNVVLAAEATFDSNKFLSAEVTKQMKIMKEETVTELKSYQDENFAVFDARIANFLDDAQIKFLLAAIGTTLLTSGIVTYLLLNRIKNSSYEAHQSKIINNQQEQIQELQTNINEMQSQNWYPQETYDEPLTQGQVSDQSRMNSWQSTSVSQNSWESPVKKEKNY